MKVFLGGTCNESTWREELIPKLDCDYFNPVVPDWTPECQKEELKQRKECDICLYVLTPKMKGFYSIAEVIDDSNKRPCDTILCVLWYDNDVGFDKQQGYSLDAVCAMARRNGIIVCHSLITLARILNEKHYND